MSAYERLRPELAKSSPPTVWPTPIFRSSPTPARSEPAPIAPRSHSIARVSLHSTENAASPGAVVQRYITDEGGTRLSYSEMWDEIGEAVDGTPDEGHVNRLWESDTAYKLSEVQARLAHAGAHPTGLAGGQPSVLKENQRYGARYLHTVESSTGDLTHLNGITCREVVNTASPDIAVEAPQIVKEFLINNNNGLFEDNVFTRPDLVKMIVDRAREEKLNIVRLVSDQTFQWKDNVTAEWHDFAQIPIVFGVTGLKGEKPLTYTSSNGKISTEPYKE